MLWLVELSEKDHLLAYTACRTRCSPGLVIALGRPRNVEVGPNVGRILQGRCWHIQAVRLGNERAAWTDRLMPRVRSPELPVRPIRNEGGGTSRLQCCYVSIDMLLFA